MGRCTAITRTGQRCQKLADGANGLCVSHDPARAAARQKAAAKGGRAKGNLEVRAAKEELKAVIADVKDGKLDRNDAAVMLQGYRALQGYLELERKIRETDELSAEIEELKREYGHAS